jgi:hypothetical protein
LFDETCTHGTAFCRVSATASSTFGITSGEIAVKSQRGYYASAAIRPENVDAFGNYTITLNFYDEFDVLILTKTSTIEVRRNDRWAYIAAFATSSETIGASYAKVRITADVDTPEPGHTFHVDRVVFRE